MSSTSHLSLTLFLCILSILAVDSATQHGSAPAPSVDCSSLVLNMADCLSYVSNGSTTTKPEGTCCSGLKTVLKADAQCLCEAFKSSAQFGVVLNVTKALTLPTACKIKAPSASNCGLLVAPSGAPGLSPSNAVAPTASIGSNDAAPVPSPGGTSGSQGLPISVSSLAVGLMAALFCSF